MKQSDIFSVIIVASIGILAAYFSVNAILGDPNLRAVSFKTIEEISPSLETPDSELFNLNAINPTVEVYVGDCEDSDRNGILSRDEMIACGKLNADTAPKNEMVKCVDGTPVIDAKECPENKQSNSASDSANTKKDN